MVLGQIEIVENFRLVGFAVTLAPARILNPAQLPLEPALVVLCLPPIRQALLLSQLMPFAQKLADGIRQQIEVSRIMNVGLHNEGVCANMQLRFRCWPNAWLFFTST